MGLFSFLRKNKQEPASTDSEFYSRAEEESTMVRGRGRGKRKDNQSNEPVDPVLPEKKRARRRLVGAIALVLAAVIGLPMIFDSEPKPISDDITIQIPSKDKPASKVYDMPPSSDAAPSTPSAAAATDGKDQGAAAAVAAAGSVIAATAVGVANGKDATKPAEAVKANGSDKVHVPTNAQAVGISDKKNEVKPELTQTQKTIPKIESKAEQKSATSADHKSNDSSQAKDAVDASTVNSTGSKAAADKKTGKFAVQVAALVTQEKINELQAKLKKAGFTTFTQKVATASGASTRIRVGPYATKEEADKARAKLIRMDLKGTIVPTGH